MDAEPLTLSVPEAGRLLSVGRNVSFRLAKEGVIPAIRLGKKLRVPKAALLRMLEAAGNERKGE